MEQIPKIVRERLRGGRVGVSHPDADLLTAFSEQALPDRERGLVLEHLARCGVCRDVLALALPEMEVSEPVVQPSPRSWFAWPALRWGFVAAGIAIVATLGTVEFQNAHRSTNVASREPAPTLRDEQSLPKSAPAVPAPEVPNASGSAPASTPEALKSEAKHTPAAATTAEPSPARRANGDRDIERYSANVAHGPRVANQMQLNSNFQQQNAQFPVQAGSSPEGTGMAKQARPEANKPQVPSMTQMVEVAPPAPVTAQSENPTVMVQSQPLDQQTLNGGQAEATADATRPPVVGFSAGAKVTTRSSGGIQTVGGPLYSQSARWTINSSGGLQRSTDEGKSWQDVNVGDSSPAASAMTLAVNARPKELEKKDEESDKVERSKSATPVFRAVSANGPDVWAGGSGGMLYHSTDAGGHWTRVIPAYSGATLTGEILTVAFSDPQHGRVTTSSSEVWMTQDDGQTWQRQ